MLSKSIMFAGLLSFVVMPASMAVVVFAITLPIAGMLA